MMNCDVVYIVNKNIKQTDSRMKLCMKPYQMGA